MVKTLYVTQPKKTGAVGSNIFPPRVYARADGAPYLHYRKVNWCTQIKSLVLLIACENCVDLSSCGRSGSSGRNRQDRQRALTSSRLIDIDRSGRNSPYHSLPLTQNPKRFPHPQRPRSPPVFPPHHFPSPNSLTSSVFTSPPTHTPTLPTRTHNVDSLSQNAHDRARALLPLRWYILHLLRLKSVVPNIKRQRRPY